MLKPITPEIEVMLACWIGLRPSSDAKERAASGPSITVHGTRTVCSSAPDHST
jgi:hypothetical protein